MSSLTCADVLAYAKKHLACDSAINWLNTFEPSASFRLVSETHYVSALALAQQYPADAVEARLREVMGMTDAAQ